MNRRSVYTDSPVAPWAKQSTNHLKTQSDRCTENKRLCDKRGQSCQWLSGKDRGDLQKAHAIPPGVGNSLTQCRRGRFSKALSKWWTYTIRHPAIEEFFDSMQLEQEYLWNLHHHEVCVKGYIEISNEIRIIFLDQINSFTHTC